MVTAAIGSRDDELVDPSGVECLTLERFSGKVETGFPS